MSDVPYLIRLGNRLADQLQSLDESRRERHRNFLLGFQMPDGGFRGRDGDSDLYYTSFAVRGLMMLGGMESQTAEQISKFLKEHETSQLNVIDLMNWLATALALQVSSGIDLLAEASASFPQQIIEQLESVRTEDGGYAKSTEGASGSTYHSLLVMLTYQLVGIPQQRPNALVQFIYDRQRDDGGFVEIAPMRRSGTNPTAAACAILQEFGAVDDEIRDDLRVFLKEVKSDEGGYQANSRVPFADSLSTFTGILTSQDLNLGRLVDAQKIHHWLTTQLEFPTGGFRAATWDEAADVEYTFYGLGLLALLNEMNS
ncbi:prenyltransferase/squalene oxidase repeat-containing protein [Thalassoglobus polymorphus]|uniref:Geranylgeranyl transferase type II subunit beta n=1 Tax=Thalassoglobus polymorphus TaxID=2527994 RepID=A0A517QNE6_9PLAN|nr:prenyltransferase/squalene oxidase repeat-containing protein [Thalassoglobus polymorphus]QDT33152.1 Prenyltransferase and squalene oxidase repeat protein [Thalassoglobus polymorphus]